MYVGGKTTPLEAKKKHPTGCSKLYVERYEAAKQLFQEGQYAAAQASFDALRTLPDASPLRPYARFYCALAAYRNGEKALAQEAFLELAAQFPTWNKQNEARYWAAQCLFEAGLAAEALQQLVQIRDKRMTPAVQRLKRHFLQALEGTDALYKLLQSFPKDVTLQQILFKKAARQAYYTRDETFVRQLEEQCRCSIQRYNPLRKLVSKRKEAYSVAVLLPFLLDTFDYEACSDAFVVELYQGIRLGVQQLASEGVHLKLFAFDTQKDAAATAALLQQEALKQMDLIVGPLYPSTVPLVADFARKNKINFVNPISSNAAVVHDHPFAFLFQASSKTQVEKAVQLTLQDIASKDMEEPCVAVFYAPSEAPQARAYKQQIERALGKKVGCFVELADHAAVKDFLSRLQGQEQPTEGVTEIQQPCAECPDREALKKMTHMYVPSSQSFLVSSVVSLPLKLGIRPQIIGHEQWLKKDRLTLHQLTQLPISFLAPVYVNFADPKVRALRRRFVEETGAPPTLYSFVGYELICFFGRMLAKHGTYFQKEWGNAFSPGLVFQGFLYGFRHDNGHVPIVRLERGAWACVPTPSLPALDMHRERPGG